MAMISRVLAGVSCFASAAVSEDAIVDAALNADDACSAGSGECGLELRQLRGEVNSAEAIIAAQMQENKKYEVALDDESGTVCTAPKDWKTTGISCGGGTKCCTSRPSYLAGQSHASQAHLSLYSICCSLSDHCKYDTIFVSCAGGPGPDDYSGVIAGLEQDAQISEDTDDEVNVEQDVVDVATEEDVNVDVSLGKEAANEQAEEGHFAAQNEKGDASKPPKNVCLNHQDMAYWKDPGAKNFHNDLTECGLQCNGVKKCSAACMEVHGYSRKCSGCMGKLGWCSMKTCSHKCINKGCQSVYNGCFNGTETEKGKCTTYWMQHNCVTNKNERVYTMSDECIECMHDSKCGTSFEKCSGLELEETTHQKHRHVLRWWLNKN